MKLSIVATLYQSAHYVGAFVERSTNAAKQLAGEDYEIVLVNDGSPDDSLGLAMEWAEKDPHLVVVDLSRNFGHHKAMMTGLANARGERVFLIDSDLEEEPEWLTSFARQMDVEKSDVVCGVQSKRRGGIVERFVGALYYWLFDILTGIVQPKNVVTARLMSRRYVDALILHQEQETNITGLWIITGFKQSRQTIEKHSTSPSTYSLSRKINLFVKSIISFSSLPLVFTFYSGLLISTSAVAYIAYLVFRYLFIAAPPSGYTSTIASIWLFSGLIIFFMGLQGIYISTIFLEVKQRPYTIIRGIYRYPAKEGLENNA